MQGFTPEAIDALVQRPECDVILIEADGSRGMPLKAPDEHEPCIPKSSCCVIAVMGGHTLGAKVSTENVHRWSQFADITGLTPDATLQLSDLVALVRHPQGAFKNVPQGCRRVWFINRFSQCENAIAQSELLQPLQQHDVEAIWAIYKNILQSRADLELAARVFRVTERISIEVGMNIFTEAAKLEEQIVRLRWRKLLIAEARLPAILHKC